MYGEKQTGEGKGERVERFKEQEVEAKSKQHRHSGGFYSYGRNLLTG